MQNIEESIQHFEELVKEQLERVTRMKECSEPTNYAALEQIVIGCCAGDGIGPIITKEAKKVLEEVLKEEISSERVIIKDVEGLTIEERVKANKAIPDETLKELKACHVILKGPTTTPSKGEGPNIESANVAMRRELDLFANVRPVKVEEEGIDWTFFRENTEGEYVLGSQGVEVDEDLAFDFRVVTTQGVERIARAAFEFAKHNNKKRVAIITKANILKKTDGKFLKICYDVAKEYPEIKTDDWFVDIMAANLINEDIRADYEVFILPNLYGDIITDEAAQIQGGVGTAGSANIGSRYAMFEAVHGSAPRMIEAGIEKYANPASIIKAVEMLLRHIGYIEHANRVMTSLKIAEKEMNMTGNVNGDTGEAFAKCVIDNL